jgi:hypothetical protein
LLILPNYPITKSPNLPNYPITQLPNARVLVFHGVRSVVGEHGRDPLQRPAGSVLASLRTA